MTSIMNRAATVAIFSGAASLLTVPAAAAAPAEEVRYPVLETICDTLGPDTVVFAESDLGRADQAPVIGWIDVTERDHRTGTFLSHDRVYESRPNVAVDEICSFDLDGRGSSQTITLGLLLDGPVRQSASDGRDAWT